MLLSLLLSLTPTAEVPILGPLGRPANAWFLGQVTRCQPAIAAALHDSKESKPYTVSTLLNDRGQPVSAGAWVAPGESCWLRVTTFDEQLSETTLEQIVRQLPERITLYKMVFRLDGWTLDPAQHPWAGQSTFRDMAQEPYQVAKDLQVRLEFASPTAFRSGSADVPLPIPAQVFRSYWEKWNAFAPEAMQLAEQWPDFARACIMVSELTMVNTQRWSFAEGTRGVVTGYTGTVGFVLLPKRQCGIWQDYWDGASQVLQSLARFAFYCGTGHHTTIGLGQTRLTTASYQPARQPSTKPGSRRISRPEE